MPEEIIKRPEVLPVEPAKDELAQYSEGKVKELVEKAQAQALIDYEVAKDTFDNLTDLMEQGDSHGLTKTNINMAIENMNRSTSNLIALASLMARVKMGPPRGIQIANMNKNSDDRDIDRKELIEQIEAIVDKKKDEQR